MKRRFSLSAYILVSVFFSASAQFTGTPITANNFYQIPIVKQEPKFLPRKIINYSGTGGWDTSKWSFLDTTHISYDNNLLVSSKFHKSKYTNTQLETYSYNAEKQQVSHVIQKWNTSQGTWKNEYMDSNTYDSHNNLTHELVYLWDTINQIWYLYSGRRTTYTYFPSGAAHTKTIEIYCNCNFSGPIVLAWNTVNRYVYTYNNDNQTTSIRQYYWGCQQTNWSTNYDLDTFFYNTDKDKIAQFRLENSNTNELVPYSAWTNIHTQHLNYANSNIVHEFRSDYSEWDAGAKKWKALFNVEVAFDELGGYQEDYLDATGDAYNDQRLVRRYDEHGNLTINSSYNKSWSVNGWQLWTSDSTRFIYNNQGALIAEMSLSYSYQDGYYNQYKTIYSDFIELNTNNYSPENLLSIYPNPSREKFFIQIPLNSSVTIYNLLGEKMFEEKDVVNLEVDCKDWPVGTYIINLRDMQGHVTTKKFIKD